MTYAYDNYIQLPTVDLYDTQMMAMAINAAKDMYDRGQQQIKDFYKEYGDFMSPFAKDMEAYGNMVGGVRNLINTAYANGIDLLRSPEGRALISKAVYSVDPGEFNRMRHNAKVGYEYLSEIEKARAKGEFDQDYEDFLLRQAGLGPFDQFSSKMGMWNRPGPGVYQDVNKWTHHLFDNMELSYDPELSKQYPGFMAYTKSRDTMNQIVDNNIAGLLKTDLGKYRLQQLKDAGLSDEQAVSALKKMVVDSNYEQNQLKLVEDPIYMQQLKYQHDLNVASVRAGNRGTKTNDTIAYDSAEGLFYRGLIKSGGTEHYSDVEQAVEDGRDNIVKRQIDLLKQASAQKMSSDKTVQYMLDNLSIEEAPSNFFRYTQITPTDGVMPIDKRLTDRLFSDDSVISHAYGVTFNRVDGTTGKVKKQARKYTDRTNLEGKEAMPTRKVRTVFTQKANGDYAIRQFWQMDIGTTDENGAWHHEKYMEFELPTSREATHNVPAYTKYKRMSEQDQNVIIRPSLSEDKNTLGLKNTGSHQVNKYEGVPKNMWFSGTSNNEAYELP